jgi:glycosyltransferase involved in cell wall biosynthesis
MLQEGALSNGWLKKIFFLKLLMRSGLLKDAAWHATDTQEEEDIKKYFGRNSKVKIAPNVPKAPSATLPKRIKAKGELRVVYFSLIARKKNLKLALNVLHKMIGSVVFHIYGPIKDQDYWNECQPLINTWPVEIEYRGAIEPETVQQVLQQYHAFILPTHGENFGHAIYESLSVGTPTIISPHTPWVDLELRHAGINISVSNESDWVAALKKFQALDQSQFDVFSEGAYRCAIDYFKSLDFRKKYNLLFNNEY